MTQHFTPSQNQYIAKLIKKAKAEERKRAFDIIDNFINDILENKKGDGLLDDLLAKIMED